LDLSKQSAERLLSHITVQLDHEMKKISIRSREAPLIGGRRGIGEKAELHDPFAMSFPWESIKCWHITTEFHQSSWKPIRNFALQVITSEKDANVANDAQDVFGSMGTVSQGEAGSRPQKTDDFMDFLDVSQAVEAPKVEFKRETSDELASRKKEWEAEMVCIPFHVFFEWCCMCVSINKSQKKVNQGHKKVLDVLEKARESVRCINLHNPPPNHRMDEYGSFPGVFYVNVRGRLIGNPLTWFEGDSALFSRITCLELHDLDYAMVNEREEIGSGLCVFMWRSEFVSTTSCKGFGAFKDVPQDTEERRLHKVISSVMEKCRCLVALAIHFSSRWAGETYSPTVFHIPKQVEWLSLSTIAHHTVVDISNCNLVGLRVDR